MKNEVAEKLRGKGFVADVKAYGVAVRLANRPVSEMELVIALDFSFHQDEMGRGKDGSVIIFSL